MASYFPQSKMDSDLCVCVCVCKEKTHTRMHADIHIYLFLSVLSYKRKRYFYKRYTKIKLKQFLKDCFYLNVHYKHSYIYSVNRQCTFKWTMRKYFFLKVSLMVQNSTLMTVWTFTFFDFRQSLISHSESNSW